MCVTEHKWKLRSWSLCLVQRTRKWISGESWRKRGTKRVARSLKPSAQRGPSEFLAVRARRDEHRRKLRAQKEVSITPPMLQQKSFSSTNERQWQADLEEQRSVWSSPEKVPVALEDHLEKCIDMKVEIAALELLLEPEQAVVCLRYILKHACKEDRQQPFSRSSTPKRKTTTWWPAGGAGKERGAVLQERWQNDWQDMEYGRKKWQRLLRAPKDR